MMEKGTESPRREMAKRDPSPAAQDDNRRKLARRDTAEGGCATLAEPEYEALRERCAALLAEGQQKLLEVMWRVGKAIIDAIGAHRQEYGARVVHRLAGDLGMDHATVVRAIQFYETYPQPQIVAARQQLPGLSWSKVRMLLPLDPDLRAEMEKRLASGEIRTDEQLRDAIYLRKDELGLIDQDYTRPQHLGVKGVDAEKARTLLRRLGGDAQLTFNMLTTWGDDYVRYYVRDGVPEQQRVAAKRALQEHIRQMQRIYEEL